MITEEDIMKLKQLDRIEYRQRVSRLNYQVQSPLPIIGIFFMIFIMITQCYIIDYLRDGIANEQMYSIFMYIVIGFYILTFIILLYNEVKKLLKRIEEKNKIDREYFKTEVKK